MNKINKLLHWVCLIGFFLILLLPLLNLPPWFSPPSWGKTILFRNIVAILLFLYIAQTLIKKEFIIKTSKVLWWLLGLLGIFGLATIFSMDKVFSFWGNPYRAGGFLNFAFYIIFAVLAFLILKKSDWPKMLNLSLIVGVFVSLIGVFQNYGILSKIFVPVADQPWSTIGGSTFLAAYLLFLVFLSLTFIIKSIKNLDRGWFFYLPALLLYLFVIFLTISRAAYIGLFIGLIYFIFAYPTSGERLKRFKKALLVLAGLAIIFVVFVNVFPNENAPGFIKRLSIEKGLNDPRLAVWQVSTKAILDKPLLGYGPENFSIAFDEHYDISLKKLRMTPGESVPTSWYDRAHSIIFEVATTAGIPALIIYLGLFVSLFIGLRKKTLINHGLKTALLAYFVSNVFGFDVFSTYLLFFLLVAYSMFLITETYPEKTIKIKTGLLAYPLIALLFIGVIAFIWIYNFQPFQINTKINIANQSAQRGQIEKSIQEMEEILPINTFLDSYLISNYLDIINTHIVRKPSQSIILVPRGIELLKRAVEIKPNYTRYWLLLGTYYNLMLENYQNAYPEEVEKWKEEANKAFQKTLELSPNRQETLLRWTRMHVFVNELDLANEKIEKCIDLNPSLGDCYWTKALIKFKEQNLEEAKINIQLAKENGYRIDDERSLLELQKMYYYLDNYKELISDFCEINIGLYETNIDNPDYQIKALACYIKENKKEEALELAKYIKTYRKENTEIVDNLMKQLK